MTTTKKPWKAPTLTHYGKLAELTQAGSTLIGTPQTLPLFDPQFNIVSTPAQIYNTDNDGSTALDSADVVLITTSSGQQKLIPVKFLNKTSSHGTTTYGYDSNENGIVDFTLRDLRSDGTLDSVGTNSDGGVNGVWFDHYNS